MSQSYNTTLVNKIIADFQKGEKNSSFEKLKEFLNTNQEDNSQDEESLPGSLEHDSVQEEE